MNEKEIWAHLNRKYKGGEEKATFLVEALSKHSRLLSYDSRESIRRVFKTPICTGIIFEQLAEQLQIRKRKYHNISENNELKKEDIEYAVGFLKSLTEPFGRGSFNGERFCASYVANEALLLTMRSDGPLLEKLVEAFSKAAGYKPFCKYTDLGGMKTYEWAKEDAERRFRELSDEKRKDDLVRLF